MLKTKRNFILILMAAVTCITLGMSRSADAVDPASWIWRNPTPQGNHLHGATYGNGQFIAVGEYGMIETSRDGSTWAVRSSGTVTSLSNVAAGPVGFVAVGSLGVIVSSSDGISWTVRASGTTNDLYGATYGPGGFVAVGMNGTILRSSDGVAWTSITPPTANGLTGVTYGAAGYVAVSADTSFVSTDGSTWAPYGFGATYNLDGVIYGGGKYVAVGRGMFGANNVAISTDGATWTPSTVSGSPQLSGVTYGAGGYAAVDKNGSIWSSPDGSSWTARTTHTYSGGTSGVAYGAGTYVAVSGYGSVQTSQNGTSWTLASSGTVNSFQGIAWGSSGLVAVGGGNDRPIWTSPTGTLWSQNALTTPSSLSSVMFGNGQYVATADGGFGTSYILSSSTGSVWLATGTTTTVYNAVASDGTGTYVAVGKTGKIATSPDAVTWTPVTLGAMQQTLNNFYGITYGNGNFIAVGQIGAGAFMIYSSPDGTNWTTRWQPATPCYDLKSVAWGNGTFVTVGAAGSVLTASDTDVATWTQRSVPTSESLTAVAYGNGYFVATGNMGGLYWSSDNGVTWTLSPDHGSTLYSITYDGVNDKFFAAGWAGTILQTGYLLDVTKAGNGNGTVTSADGGINCGTVCTGAYDQGASVTLTATPGAGGSVFTGWSCGACTGTGPCTVTLNANAICTAIFTDSTPPSITGTSPLPGATNVLLSSAITATFSEAMEPATINNAAFTLSSGASVTGMVTYNAATFTATFTPSSSLVSATTYTATITTNVMDAGGNALAGAYSWSFTTEPPHTFSGDMNAAVGTTGLTWITGGNATWFSQTTTYYDSGAAAQSGDIADNGSTWMETTINGPMNLSFWWKVSSEQTWDYLRFSIDGVQQSLISGLPAWEQKTYTIPVGAHTLKWSYTKDSSNSTGWDAGWVDAITLIPPDNTPPVTTATPAGTVFTTTPQNITLTCSDGTGSGCTNIYYTTDGSAPAYPVSGTTQSGASPVTVNIASNTILKFFARDLAGNSEAMKTEMYFMDLSSITAGSVDINSGATTTTNPIVTLTLSCTTGCTDIKLSNDRYAWTDLGSFTTTTTWTLSPGDGLKTVYAMFSDSSGTWSRPYSDTIVLDTMPPVNGQWHWRNPVPQGNDLHGVAYGSGAYVTVGDLGTILISLDGQTWATGFSGTSYRLSNVTFGNGTFVAVGAGGTILTSATGTTWTSRTAGTTNHLQDVIFDSNNSIFVAVGGGGTILTSSDGIAWTSRTSGTINDLNKITFGSTLFVAVGNAGTILTSGNGTTWTSRASTTTVNLSGAAFGNGTFVAVEYAGNTILTSPDGTIWTSSTTGSPNYLYGVAFGGTTFVTVGYYSGDILTSSTGTSWTPAGTSFGPLQGINYVNGAFMAVGWAGAIYSSPDGSAWTAGSGISTTTLYGVTFGNNTFVAAGVGAILASVDSAATWTNTNTPVVGPNDWQYGVGFGNNTFVALQGRGIFLTSTDGFGWSQNSSYGGINYENNFSVAFGNNAFVAVGNGFGYGGPQVYTSSNNGAAWSLQYPQTGQYLHGVTFGNGSFVAVGGGGSIITSPDGYTWTIRSSGTTNNLSAVAYGNNMFVAVGGVSNSTILTSSDGINWVTRDSGTTAWLNGITYANGIFVAVGNSGTILLSKDGVAWTPSRSGITNNLNSVAAGNNTFVAVGDNGAILQSDQFLGSALTIAINNNAGATNSTSVTLTLSCMDAGSGCSQMQISNDNFATSLTYAMSSSQTWTLTLGGGAKTVSVKFQDLYTGTWSEPVSANIVLDTTAPFTMASTPGGLYNAPQNVALFCNDGAGVGCATTYYTVDGTNPTTGSSVYAGSIAINADTTLKFYSVDIYGYSEAIRTEVYTIDMVLPTTVASPAPGIYTAAQNVTLTADEPSTIYYTTDGTMPSDPVSGSTQTAPSPALVHIVANTTLSFFAKDVAGNIETPVKTAAYIIDLTSIIVSQTTVTINNNALYTNTTDVSLALTCTDSGGNCTNMQLSNGGMIWANPVSYATSAQWTLSSGDGLKTVYAMFSDHKGSWSRPYSDTIILDTTPPTSDVSGIPDVWNWKNPSPQGNSLSDITFGNGLFVAVGSGGAIITSTDGVTWTYRTSGTTYGINDITYGNGFFVAVGSYDAGGTQPAIVTSTDGINWISRTAGVTNSSLTGVSFNGTDTFVAVGWYGTILTSTDNGATWTTWTSGTSAWLNDVAFGNGTFVAVGDSGTILSSATGTSWTVGSSGDSHDSLIGVSYGNNAFVAVGYNYYYSYGTIVTLPDGGAWAKSTLPSTDQFTGVTYLNSKFIAIGIFGIRTSPDGTTWTDATSGAVGTLSGAAFGNATYVAVGAAGAILTSTDAANWTGITSGTIDNRLSVTYGNNTFVSVGAGGTILTSPDGAAWTSMVSNTPYDLYGTAYGNGVFVAVGAPQECGYSTAYSLDGGLTWTSNYGCTSGDTLQSVAYGNGIFVAVGWSGTIVTSTNGIDWLNNNSSGTSSTLNAVIFGNGIFVAVGDSGTVLTSANGIDWTSSDPGTFNSLNGVAYGNNAFVAVGDGGDGGRSILTSSDAITWTDVTPSGNSTLYGVTFGNGAFIAVGQSGTILASADGASWTDSASVTSAQLSGVVAGNNTFVVVGYSGTILQSNALTNIKNLINNGAAFTNTLSVTLTPSCLDMGSGCAEMQFSNDNISWDAPVAYLSTIPWTLAAGPDGPRTVYVKFKDNAGNWSGAFNSAIILDSAYVPPVLYTLTVNGVGPNVGAVASVCGGDCIPAIQCGNGSSSCSAVFDAKSGPVTLIEMPNAGMLFTGWTGPGVSCSGTSCKVTLNFDMTVTVGFIPQGDCTNATFSLNPWSATTPFGGGAGGTVVSQLTGSTSSCLWPVVSSGPWLTVPSGMVGGPGSGAVNFLATAGPDLLGTLSIADQKFSVLRTGSAGGLDPAFNAARGFVTASTGTVGSNTLIYATAVQPDKKIVVAGYNYHYDLVTFYNEYDGFVGRYNPDGTLDSTFGSGGIATFATSTVSLSVNTVAIQPDGMIVAGGSFNENALVVRLTATGLLDAGFGVGGMALYSGGAAWNYFMSLAFQPDGSIVAGGYDWMNGISSTIVARFAAAGIPDASFGAGGAASYHTGANTSDYINSLAIQPDGNIVAAGYAYDNVAYTNAAVLTRLTATGLLDPGFGSNGIVNYYEPSSANYYYALALQPDGKILVAGYATDTLAGTDRGLITRFTTTGLMDGNFGGNGIVSFSTGTSHYDYFNVLTLQPDGKIVAAGSTNDGYSNDDVLVLRLNADGALDPGFGYGGMVFFDSGGNGMDFANAALVQPDGKIVIAGSTYGVQYDGLVIRLLGADLPIVVSTDPAYGAAGVSPNTAVSATFNNPMDTATFDASSFILTGPSGAVTGSVSASGATATFTPLSPLTSNATYTATILSAGVKDVAGSGMVADYLWSFTTLNTGHTITASAGLNGSISPSGAVTVADGGSRTFVITPSTGFHIADVLVDGLSAGVISVYTFTNVTTDHTIAAGFAADTFPITVTAGPNGSITPGSVTAPYGTNAAFTIAPNPGYRVSDVKADGVSVGAVTSYTFMNVTAPHTLGASFAQDVIPAFSSVAPPSNSYITTANIGYALNEDVISGSVTFTRTGGAADAYSPQTFTLTGALLQTGSHSVDTALPLADGAIYTVTFLASTGTSTGSLSSTNVAFDTTAASVTIVGPLSNTYTNTANVSYTLSETIASGQLVVTRTDGADPLSPYSYTLTGTDLNAGSHTIDTRFSLINGAMYSIEFKNVIDLAGNATPAPSSINVTFDAQSVGVTGITPSIKSIVTNATIGYTLNEDALSGTVTYTRTGGAADSASPQPYTLLPADLIKGAHVVDTGLALGEGVFYTVTFQLNDKADNPATTVSNAMIFHDSNYGKGPVGNIANEDGFNIVNNADVLKMQSVMNSRPGDGNWNPVCDLNKDNRIDQKDMMILQMHYGESTPQ